MPQPQTSNDAQDSDLPINQYLHTPWNLKVIFSPVCRYWSSAVPSQRHQHYSRFSLSLTKAADHSVHSARHSFSGQYVLHNSPLPRQKITKSAKEMYTLLCKDSHVTGMTNMCAPACSELILRTCQSNGNLLVCCMWMWTGWPQLHVDWLTTLRIFTPAGAASRMVKPQTHGVKLFSTEWRESNFWAGLPPSSQPLLWQQLSVIPVTAAVSHSCDSSCQSFLWQQLSVIPVTAAVSHSCDSGCQSFLWQQLSVIPVTAAVSHSCDRGCQSFLWQGLSVIPVTGAVNHSCDRGWSLSPLLPRQVKGSQRAGEAGGGVGRGSGCATKDAIHVATVLPGSWFRGVGEGQTRGVDDAIATHQWYWDLETGQVMGHLALSSQSKCNKNNCIQRCSSRFFVISSLHCELSPTRTLKWPRHNCVKITCNTSSAYHVQNVVCHLVRRDSSAIKFDRVEITFILALLYSLKPLTNEGGEETGAPGENPTTNVSELSSKYQEAWSATFCQLLSWQKCQRWRVSSISIGFKGMFISFFPWSLESLSHSQNTLECLPLVSVSKGCLYLFFPEV